MIPLLLAAACGRRGSSDDAPLPASAAARGEAPYVRGAIIERTVGESGRVRLLVRSPSATEVRVREALVNVAPDAVIQRQDGSSATLDDLRRGDEVSVWITGPELRSLPPQVTGSAFVIHPR